MLSLSPVVSSQINSICAAWLPHRVFMCICSILTPRRSSGVRLHIISFMPLKWPWTIFIKVSSLVQILLHVGNNCDHTDNTNALSFFLSLSLSLIVLPISYCSSTQGWEQKYLMGPTIIGENYKPEPIRWCYALPIHVQWWKKKKPVNLGSSQQNILTHKSIQTHFTVCKFCHLFL